ncbi:transcriptional regulator [Lysobacter enzymogenes]|uniref:ArsR/SmtB family transcription factor n=1 Tax=Lysobacter enzymogenes TaxID=69 RepID=UPI0019D10C58|nr:metalloregulator ArsR/SmtB family transcription factor [Lysobacter enzymogenes]MBN7137170.1 transcriptional regulator [Lysobacter enzymogenes]
MSVPVRPAKPAAALKAPALRRSARVFEALGDETRLRLVVALCAGGALSIAQLTAGTDISRQAVTKHLQVLAGVGLVRDLKVGRERLWQFEPTELEQARQSLQRIGEHWDQALLRLKAFVET